MKLLYIFLAIVLFSCAGDKETKLQKFLLKGNAEINNKNYDQAIAYYKEAIRIDPCFTEALNNLGTAFFKQDRFEQAITNYQEAINCDPNYLPAYYNRANTLYELKEYFNALEDLAKIEATHPDTAVTFFTKGLVHTKLRILTWLKPPLKKLTG